MRAFSLFKEAEEIDETILGERSFSAPSEFVGVVDLYMYVVCMYVRRKEGRKEEENEEVEG